MNTLIFTKNFDNTYTAIIKGSKEKENRILKVLNFLQQDPFYPSLKTHKVNTKNFGETWSSRVTGDVRIIWDFDKEKKQAIILLAIGTHSGTHKEYK